MRSVLNTVSLFLDPWLKILEYLFCQQEQWALNQSEALLAGVGVGYTAHLLDTHGAI